MKPAANKVNSEPQLDANNEQTDENLSTDNVETKSNQGANNEQTDENLSTDLVETKSNQGASNDVSDWLKAKMTTSINAEYIGKIKTVLAAMQDGDINNVTSLLKKLVEHYLTTSSQLTDLERQIKTLTELNNSNEDAYQNSIDRITELDLELKELQASIENPTEEAPTPAKTEKKKKPSFMNYLGFYD